MFFFVFFFNDPATTEIYTLSLHDALPICLAGSCDSAAVTRDVDRDRVPFPVRARAKDTACDLGAGARVLHGAENQPVGTQLGGLLPLRLDHPALRRHIAFALRVQHGDLGVRLASR